MRIAAAQSFNYLGEKMKLKSALAGAVLSLVSLAGQAGVIYEWQPLGGDSRGFSLRMEFDESVVQSGSINLRISDWPTNPSSPLISMQMGLEGYSGYFDLSPRTDPAKFTDSVDLRLTFGRNGMLQGQIYQLDSQGAVTLASDGNIFTLVSSDNDNPVLSCKTPTSSWGTSDMCGARGVMRQVPEPGSFALLSLGAIGALFARRRKLK